MGFGLDDLVVVSLPGSGSSNWRGQADLLNPGKRWAWWSLIGRKASVRRPLSVAPGQLITLARRREQAGSRRCLHEERNKYNFASTGDRSRGGGGGAVCVDNSKV